MAATRSPIRFAETVNCPCGAPRPFGESCCADCQDVEEQESFLAGDDDARDADHWRDERKDARATRSTP